MRCSYRLLPEWVPVDARGTAWYLATCYGRPVGTIVKVGNKFRGRMICCSKCLAKPITADMHKAASHASLALYCADCPVA
jgi:hypothetical protein